MNLKNRLGSFCNNDKGIPSFIGRLVVLLAIWYGLKDFILSWFDDHLLIYLSEIKQNVFLPLLVVVCIIWVIRDVVRKYKNSYRFTPWLVWAMAATVWCMLDCRLSGDYTYLMLIGCVGYFDVVMFVLAVVYVGLAIINNCKYIKRQKNSNGDTKGIIIDDPIDTQEMDILDWKDDVKKVVSCISGDNKGATLSIAIIGSWGEGKTSFMNLVKEELVKNESKTELLLFNPRTCKSAGTIQREFFNQLRTLLSKYDGSCSNLVADYVASLQLIDGHNVVKKLINLHRLLDKQGLRDKVGSAIRGHNIKIVVVIDDFDRLTRPEVVEVLKLIDGNGSFPNMVFLTAFDPVQVSKVLGKQYKALQADFVDKFFDMSYAVPLRPYTYILEYMSDTLCARYLEDPEESQIPKVLEDNQEIFQRYIPTIRDAKRYINQFEKDYLHVRGDVCTDEFMLVELIKYRYLSEHRNLYNKKYLVKNCLFASNIYSVAKDCPKKDTPPYDIIHKLFGREIPMDSHEIPPDRLHIYGVEYFDHYFVNRIHTKLRVRDIEKVVYKGLQSSRTKLDEYLEDDEAKKDLSAYLNSVDIKELDPSTLINYAEAVTYMAMKEQTSYFFLNMLLLIDEKTLEDYRSRYKEFDVEEYKRKLLELMLDPEICRGTIALAKIHRGYILDRGVDKAFIITDEDIYPSMRKAFLELCNKADDKAEDNLLRMLYDCMEKKEEGTDRILLNKECTKAYRQHLAEHPDWYLENFVRLGMISTKADFNIIACEPFWKQIFVGAGEFQKWLDECEGKNLPCADRVRNFWKLYEANGYEPIEFSNQGDVQEKINNNLNDEVELLHKLQEIDNQLDKLLPFDEKMDSSQLESVKKELQDYLKRIEGIELNVKYKDKLKKKINRYNK